jgi:hypothetical protein
VRSLAVKAWGPAADDSETVAHRGAQVYAALTMCRMLHTLETGEVVSKQAAGRWALTALDERWRPLIERALAWKKTDPQENVPGDAQATVELIRLTAARWRADEDGQARG